MGLACNPSLLIADEPDHGPDVTIQVIDFLNLMEGRRISTTPPSFLSPTPRAWWREIADYVAVAYAGSVRDW